MKRPSLTVVMPNYNHARFLTESVTRLLDQLDADDEFIFIDDCSADDSLRVFEQVASSHPAVRIVRNAENRGVIFNMNEGLALAGRHYIYFAAADDVVLPGLLERSLEMLAKHPDAAFSTAMTFTMDETGGRRTPFPTLQLRSEAAYLAPSEARRALMRDDTWILGNTTIYRVDAVRAVGGFRAELGSFTDGFVGRLLACRHGCCFIPERLAVWRRMTTAYSFVGSVDPVRRRTVMEEAVRLFEGEFRDDFPPGYARRWSRRWIYGAESLALRSRSANKSRFHSRLLLATRVAWLFLRYRFTDGPSVVGRRLAYLFSR